MFSLWYQSLCRPGTLRCWPATFDAAKPQVVNAREIKLKNDSACVIDDAGLQCWSNRFRLDTPDISDPTDFDVNTVALFALEYGEPVCWRVSAEGVVDGPRLKNVIGLEALSPYGGFCAQHDEGRSCWGGVIAEE